MKLLSILVLLFGFSFSVIANGNDDRNHHDHEPIPVPDVYNITNVINNYTSSLDSDKSTAMGGAVAQASKCDFGSFRLQGSLGLSTYRGVQALSLGLCQRFKEVMGSVTITHVLESAEPDLLIAAGVHVYFPK